MATNPSVKWWQIDYLQITSGLPATGLIYFSHEGGTNLGQLPYNIGFADSSALLVHYSCNTNCIHSAPITW